MDVSYKLCSGMVMMLAQDNIKRCDTMRCGAIRFDVAALGSMFEIVKQGSGELDSFGVGYKQTKEKEKGGRW